MYKHHKQPPTNILNDQIHYKSHSLIGTIKHTNISATQTTMNRKTNFSAASSTGTVKHLKWCTCHRKASAKNKYVKSSCIVKWSESNNISQSVPNGETAAAIQKRTEYPESLGCSSSNLVYMTSPGKSLIKGDWWEDFSLNYLFLLPIFPQAVSGTTVEK